MSAPKLHVLLPLSTLDETELSDTAANIQKTGSQSPLFTNAVIASGINAITAKAAVYTASKAAVAATTNQLNDDKEARDAARSGLETEITAFVGNATNIAPDAAALAGLGLDPKPLPVIAKAGPAVPAQPVAKMPKHLKGYFDASVPEPKGTRGKYVAEWSADPIGTWNDLPGTGKSRRVTGASGTKVWVRFARVRGQLQSDWCAPVLVIIP